MAIAEMPTHHEHRNMKILSRCPRLGTSTTTVEAIEQAVEDSIVVRVDDIAFSKQRMKKVAELAGLDSKDGLKRLFEQLRHTLLKQQPKKEKKGWKPKLQSIPE